MSSTEPHTSRVLNPLLPIALGGLIFRLAVLVYLRSKPEFTDEVDYRQMAESLISNHQVLRHGLLSAFRPMGEPLLIAALFKIFGTHVLAVKLAQEAVMTALPILCWKVSRNIGLSAAWSYVAAALVSFHPLLAYAAATLYPTAVTAIVLTAGILYTAMLLRRNDTALAAKSGIYLGLSGLFTTTFVPLPGFIALYFLLKRRIKVALIVILLGMLPAAIWVLRNRIVLHTWTLATNGGMNLYLGANDEATPRSGNWVPEPGIAGNEVFIDHVLKARGVAWIRLHPKRWTELCLARSTMIIDSVGRPRTNGVPTGIGVKLIGASMFILISASLIGLWLYRSSVEALVMSAALGLVIASSALTIAKPRFRLPCDPILMVFSCGAFSRLSAVLKGRKLSNSILTSNSTLSGTMGSTES